MGRRGRYRGTSPVIRGKKKKPCPVAASGIVHIDYKDTELLQKFVTDRGKILPRRITGVCAKNQRLITKAINQARHMALMSFVSES